MQHASITCPVHHRAVVCSGPDDANELVGTCDWGGHPVTMASPAFLAASRSGQLGGRVYDPAKALARHASGVTTSSVPPVPVVEGEPVPGGPASAQVGMAPQPVDAGVHTPTWLLNEQIAAQPAEPAPPVPADQTAAPNTAFDKPEGFGDPVNPAQP